MKPHGAKQKETKKKRTLKQSTLEIERPSRYGHGVELPVHQRSNLRDTSQIDMYLYV